jgi:hypothetical protein
MPSIAPISAGAAPRCLANTIRTRYIAFRTKSLPATRTVTVRKNRCRQSQVTPSAIARLAFPPSLGRSCCRGVRIAVRVPRETA